MKNTTTNPHLCDNYPDTGGPAARINRYRRGKYIASLVAALLLLYGQPAAACLELATCVGLTIESETDANGSMTILDGSKVKVSWEVLANDDKLLNRADRIQLLRASDDTVVSSAVRGKGSSGSVKLKVKNSAGEELYLRYRVKKDGSFPAQTPDLMNPDRVPLVAIAGASLADLTIGLNALVNAATTNVVHVATSGGDYSSPVDAMTDFASWCDSPTSSSRCLVRIMPGTYSLGTNQLLMQSFVDIEGAGESVTRLVGDVSLPIDSGGVVVGATDAELRNLTVESLGSGGQSGAGLAVRASANDFVVRQVTAITSGFSFNTGIYQPFTSSTLRSVTVEVFGSGSLNRGIYSGGSGTPKIIGAEVTVSGGNANYGLMLSNVGTVSYQHVNVSASGNGAGGLAIFGSANNVSLLHSKLTSSGDSIVESINTSSTIKVGHSQLDGAVNGSGSTFTCVFVSDGSFAALDASCQ